VPTSVGFSHAQLYENAALSTTEIYNIGKKMDAGSFAPTNFYSNYSGAITDGDSVTELPNTVEYSTLGSFTQATPANRLTLQSDGLFSSDGARQMELVRTSITTSKFTLIMRVYITAIDFVAGGGLQIHSHFADYDLPTTTGLYIQTRTDDGLNVNARFVKDTGAVSSPLVPIADWNAAYGGRWVIITYVFDSGIVSATFDNISLSGSAVGTDITFGSSGTVYIMGFQRIADRYAPTGSGISHLQIYENAALSVTEIYNIAKNW